MANHGFSRFGYANREHLRIAKDQPSTFQCSTAACFCVSKGSLPVIVADFLIARAISSALARTRDYRKYEDNGDNRDTRSWRPIF